MLFHYHDGEADFPHGAGASDEGWYVYESFADQEPCGPYPTLRAALVDTSIADGFNCPDGALGFDGR